MTGQRKRQPSATASQAPPPVRLISSSFERSRIQPFDAMASASSPNRSGESPLRLTLNSPKVFMTRLYALPWHTNKLGSGTRHTHNGIDVPTPELR